MRFSKRIAGFLLVLSSLFSLGLEAKGLELPAFFIEGIEETVIIEEKETHPSDTNSELAVPYLTVNGKLQEYVKKEQGFEYRIILGQESEIKLNYLDYERNLIVEPIPLWLSIIPPLIAILLAFFFKEVVTALFFGLFFGALVIELFQHTFIEAWAFAFMRSFDTYIVESLYDQGHLSVILFTLMIGGMVSVISKNGGMQGIVLAISKFATSARSGQFATYFLGLAIFFDDYANTLVVGKTMKPISDQLKISREKLAYLVDSTAAPIASIALITTWIGAELGYIADGVERIDAISAAPYSIFLNSIAYSYYPLLALAFIFILIYKGRDFGPMYHAEQKARTQSQSKNSVGKSADKPEKETHPNLLLALIPIATLLLVTIVGLAYTGYDEELWKTKIDFHQKISATIGAADSYLALLWGSGAALIAAIKTSIFIGKQSLVKLIEHATEGVKDMLPAIVILVLAWSLAGVIEELHTANFLSTILSDRISPYFIPTVTFILAALIAFSTGSSWGTMAILYPLILPLSWEICELNQFDYATSIHIFYNTVSTVLAGAVLGDHCSPISDTTILSSLASECDHVSHVRTQMPYALTVGVTAILFGTIPAAYGSPFWINFPLAIAVLWLIIHLFGKKSESKSLSTTA